MNNSFKEGDNVMFNGKHVEVTRVIDDKIYIKDLKYPGITTEWVRNWDLKSEDKSIITQSEGTLKTRDGEILNYRVYSDGWVKIEGQNMRKDFKTKEEAENWIDR